MAKHGWRHYTRIPRIRRWAKSAVVGALATLAMLSASNATNPTASATLAGARTCTALDVSVQSNPAAAAAFWTPQEMK